MQAPSGGSSGHGQNSLGEGAGNALRWRPARRLAAALNDMKPQPIIRLKQQGQRSGNRLIAGCPGGRRWWAGER